MQRNASQYLCSIRRAGEGSLDDDQWNYAEYIGKHEIHQIPEKSSDIRHGRMLCIFYKGILLFQ